MLPGTELMGCSELAVPAQMMHHVVRVESAYNPYAIGVVGGRLQRQPRNLPEAVATARMLEQRGYNFSVGLAQVNRFNLKKYGLDSYEEAFQACPNLQAGSRILAECHGRARGDWGDSLSCYYSGNFVTGYRHGYVQKVFASMQTTQGDGAGGLLRDDAIPLATLPQKGIDRRVSAGTAKVTARAEITPDRAGATSQSAVNVFATGNGSQLSGSSATGEAADLSSSAPRDLRDAQRVQAEAATVQTMRQPEAQKDAAFVF